MLFSSGSKSSGPKPAPKKAGVRRGSADTSVAPGGSRDQSLYASRKNIQTQRNGFGTFVQKFQLAGGKSKYGVPIFLANGNVNPAYLAAERREMAAQSKRNRIATENKRKKLVA